MNYLAHALLSGSDPDLLVGNFIADHVRGRQFAPYPPKVTEGILLHRKIDTFTDAHPLFKQSKRLFYDGFERHSSILIDIYFDHLLARKFEHYAGRSLDDFSENAYKIYSSQEYLFPETSSRFLEYVIRNNIYKAYSSLEGVQTVLFHLSGRLKHQVRLDESVSLFLKNESLLEEHFETFFQELLSEFSAR